jgi:uracil-DNA glycosylase
MNARRLELLHEHQQQLRRCRKCPDMQGPVVVGPPVLSKLLLVGQAPGDREPLLGRPFAWTAGKQLFKWFAELGVDEATFRARVYMAATCRCFPGKQPRGGDRVPSDAEVEQCRPWLDRELELLRPELIVPIGKLAIARFLPSEPLVQQIGRLHATRRGGRTIPVLPLPHPSGASTWPRTEPGKTLTRSALRLLGEHPVWRRLFERATASARDEQG